MGEFPRLLLGPLLRHVGEREATVWVETDRPCQVEVLGAGARTFTAHDRHYALVSVQGLQPGTRTPYTVCLDGHQVWPEWESRFPPSAIRTVDRSQSFRLSFGSCRMTLPPRDVAPRSHGVDVLRALATRALSDARALPDLLLLVGDQVYADELTDELAPHVHQEDREQGGRPVPPDGSVADFEEYARLYGVSWREAETRWLLSTVPSAMIFDDHDVHDDWNTSHRWREDIRAAPWWRDRIVGALASYWIYQHLGNLTQEELAADNLYQRVLGAEGDVGSMLDEFAQRADQDPDSYRWSHARDIGDVRLLVIDSRAGRVLSESDRLMVDAHEWEWLQEKVRTTCNHLLIGTSLPWLLPRPIHDLEGWNEAVCGGAWGARWRRWGEKIRQGADLEHWASFRHSFNQLANLLGEVAARPDGPASVVVLSGDVHYSYLANARYPDGTRVFQAVCSPLRNPLGGMLRRANAVGFWRPFTLLGRVLSRTSGVSDPDLRWEIARGPWFDNALATVETTGRTAGIRWESAVERDGQESLEELGSALLTPDAAADDTPAVGQDAQAAGHEAPAALTS